MAIQLPVTNYIEYYKLHIDNFKLQKNTSYILVLGLYNTHLQFLHCLACFCYLLCGNAKDEPILKNKPRTKT